MVHSLQLGILLLAAASVVSWGRGWERSDDRPPWSRGPWGRETVQEVFSPVDIDGLCLWLRADLDVTYDESNRVSAWADQSGNGEDFVQSTDAKKPVYVANALNGKPILRTDGVDDFMANSTLSSASKDFTFFIVHEPDALTTSYIYLFSIQTGYMNIAHTIGTEKKTGIYDGTYRAVALATDNWQILVWKLDATNDKIYMWRDGASLGNKPYTELAMGGNIGIFAKHDGSGNRYPGDTAEIIVYDSVLSGADRQKVEKYLSKRYGITI